MKSPMTKTGAFVREASNLALVRRRDAANRRWSSDWSSKWVLRRVNGLGLLLPDMRWKCAAVQILNDPAPGNLEGSKGVSLQNTMKANDPHVRWHRPTIARTSHLTLVVWLTWVVLE